MQHLDAWHYQPRVSSRNSRVSSPTGNNNSIFFGRLVLFEIVRLGSLLQQLWGALQAAGLSYSYWLCARQFSSFYREADPGKRGEKKKRKRDEGGKEKKTRSCWATHAIRARPLRPSRGRLCSWKPSASDERRAKHVNHQKPHLISAPLISIHWALWLILM